MIDVSLIDNNMLSLNFQPIWINQILDLIRNELNNSIENRKQMLDLRSFPGSDQMLFGDPERLYQAFRNILSNAIKFTPDGGKIMVDGRTLPGFSGSDCELIPELASPLRIRKQFLRNLGNWAMHRCIPVEKPSSKVAGRDWAYPSQKASSRRIGELFGWNPRVMMKRAVQAQPSTFFYQFVPNLPTPNSPSYLVLKSNLKRNRTSIYVKKNSRTDRFTA